jgi:hypothetical protein
LRVLKSQRLFTCLRAQCYDPAGVGCYLFNGFSLRLSAFSAPLR